MNHPLGRYAEGVAAVVSLSLVVCWLVIILLTGSAYDDLKDAVLIALGYVFGAKGAQAAERIAERATVAQAVAQAAERSERAAERDA